MTLFEFPTVKGMGRAKVRDEPPAVPAFSWIRGIRRNRYTREITFSLPERCEMHPTRLVHSRQGYPRRTYGCSSRTRTRMLCYRREKCLEHVWGSPMLMRKRAHSGMSESSFVETTWRYPEYIALGAISNCIPRTKNAHQFH